MITTVTHEISTTGQGDTQNVTDAVAQAITQSKVRAGIVTVFVVGSTAGVTTIEFEAGAVHDLNGVFETLAPRNGTYRHHLQWGDDNGSSHVRAALLGPSVTIPFREGHLLLGTWQQIVVTEFDTRPRRRQVIVQVVGE